MSRLLENLNPAQLEAVTSTEGPLLVIAGAGSGKTKALTTRLAHIVSERKAEPHNLLAVTFTNKAAQEMRQRVASMLGIDIQSLAISTFHSFCARLLRIEAEAIGYQRNFVIYDTEDSKALMKQCVEELGLSGNQFSPQALLRRVSNLKNKLQNADEFAGNADGYFESRIASAFALYETRLLRAGAMDFDDLITKSVRMLQTRDDIKGKYRRRFKYLMVDEYQDTNHSQYTLLRLLTDTHHNICVVGDEDQSIYGWRGADISNIRNFEKDFPGAKVVTLEENYRSTQIILDLASTVIANNTERKEKHLRANNTGGEKAELLLTDNAESEAQEITRRIKNRSQELSLNEMVVLYRTVAQSRAFENALIKQQVPYQIVGGVSFYQLKEIKDVTSYLRLVANPADDVSFARSIKYPKRGFGDTSLKKLRDYAAERSTSLYQAAQSPEFLAELGPRPTNILTEFITKIESFRDRAGLGSVTSAESAEANAHALSIDLLTQELVDEFGFEKEITREAESEVKAQARLDNLDEFISSTVEFAAKQEDASLPTFLEEVALYTSFDNYKEADQKLTMMTIHAAKGLEFTAVYLVGLEEGLFPLAKALDDPHEMEEERRLFYVAVTRARRHLTLSSAQERFRYGSFESAQSRFIAEAPEESINKTDLRSYIRTASGVGPSSSGRSLWSDNQSSGLSASRPASASGAGSSSGLTYEYEEEEVMRPGRIVRHRVFGRGKVLSVVGRGEGMKIEVHFTGIGKKTLLAKFAKLEVVG